MSPSSNKSFTQPPPNLPLSTPDLYRFHATHNPEHALYEYADSDGHSTVRTIAYREAYTAILHAAERVRGLYAPDGHTSERPVLAILAVADSITYLTTIVGAMTTGVASFPLSPRNSPAAIAHLLKTSSARRVLVSSDAAMQALMQEAITIFEATNSAVEVCGMPSFEELFVSGDARIPREEDVRIYERGRDAELLFMHSSGTTSFPKIIKFRDDNFVKWGLPFYDDPRLCGMRLGIHALPIFHTMGLIGVILPLTVGAIMCTFKPVSPPLVATTSNVLDGVIATKTDIPYVVPYFIEEWTKSPEQLKLLKSVKAVMYAGAALDKRIGDSLVELGIQLTLIYASTEAGCLNHILSPPDETNWEYFRMASHFDLALVPQDGQPGVFEPVILSNENWSPNVTNVVHNGRVGYSTGDLLLEHPRYPGYYKVFGRADEQLVLATGEKTNPLPLEGILKQDTHIENAIFFGHGRMSNGVLVQPKDPFNASDEKRLIEFRNKIWPTVVKMNNHAPQHSRIFKEMIMLTSPTKPLEVTPKGTPRRGVSLKAYESEIERLYATAAESAQDDLTSPSRWTPESAQAFVREAVRKVMRVPVEDGADLFQSGCDSLQATWIRNTIIRALRESTPVPTHTIPMSFVYSYPTVNALACYVSDLASGDSHKRGEGAKAEAKVELMRKLVDKFSRFEKPHVEALAINGNASSASAVLLTGSTGRLGCHLLAQLAACVDIARIFAVNRGSGSIDMLRKRQENMLRECGVDIPPENFRKITFVICNFGREKLGLDDEVYDQISQSVTSIIHNAWKVDFNANLDAFEPLLKGVQSIVELASRSAHKPSIFFVSSILSLQSLEPDGKPAPERASDDPHVALGTAYGESKWIAEQILSRGRAELGLRTSFARVTQLGGDSTSGIWSTREFVPKLVRLGSKLLGTLPSKDDVIDWLPVDTAASIVREVLSADEPTMNFAAVSPVPWDSIFGAFADALAIPLIPLAQWAANLRQAVDDIATEGRTLSEEDAQAFSLVDFALSEDFGKPSQRFETTAARRASSILACAPGFGAEDARRSVEYWRKSGFV